MTVIVPERPGLLDLPTELRLNIYGLLRRQQRLKAIHVAYPEEGKKAFKCSGRSLAITEVNRQMRDEALPILLDDVTIFIDLHKAGSKRAFNDWVNDIEDRTLAHIHSLHMTFSHNCTRPQKCDRVITMLMDLKKSDAGTNFVPRCAVTGEEVGELGILRSAFGNVKQAERRRQFSKVELASLIRALEDEI